MRGDFSGHKLEPPAWAFMIEEDAVRSMQVIRFAVIAREIKTGYFRDAISRARMERGPFGLWAFAGFAKHFARSRKIESRLWRDVAERGQNIVGPIDICVQRGKLILERIAHNALR